MKQRNDAKMYKIHKKCFNCVVEMEHKLRIEGKFKSYERESIANNASDYTDHLEAYLLESLNTSNQGYVSEKGEIERWKGGIDKEKLTKEIKQAVLKFKDNIEEYKNDKT